MTLEGNLEQRKLREVLSLLAHHGRTGILTVQGSREIIALSFLEGEVVSADALNQTLEDGLGKVLGDLQLVLPEDFAGLAAEHQAGGGRVVELVVERGYVSRRDLIGALRMHTYRLCRQALSWQQGEFKFYQGEEVSFEEGVTPIPVDELLFRASRDLANPRLFDGRFPDGASIYARSASGPGHQGKGTRGGEALPGLHELGPEAEELFALLDGESSVNELASASGIAEYRVTYLLHRWEGQGWVEEVGRRAETGTDVGQKTAETAVVAHAAEAAEVERRRGSSVWQELAQVWKVEAKPLPDLLPWTGRVLGLGLAVLLFVAFVGAPSRFPSGFPGTRTLVGESVLDGRDPELIRIHRAATIFFLLYGRYPEDILDLRDLNLLGAGDLERPGEAALQVSSTAVSYLIGPAIVGEVVAGVASTGAITGNFLLDPDFGLGEVSAEPPLVLLD